MSESQQNRIRAGQVHLGDSPELVYIAFRPPDKEQTLTTSGGRSRMGWTYFGQYYQKDGVKISGSP